VRVRACFSGRVVGIGSCVETFDDSIQVSHGTRVSDRY
jgi:hypothetical protein